MSIKRKSVCLVGNVYMLRQYRCNTIIKKMRGVRESIMKKIILIILSK